MSPLFADGDIVMGITEFKVESLNKFDIIVFDYQGTVFCHYYWAISDNIFENQEKLVQTRPLNPIWEKDTEIPVSNIKAVIKNHKIGLFLRMKVYLYSYLFKK